MRMTVKNTIRALSIIAAAYLGTTVLYVAIRFNATHQRCDDALILQGDPGGYEPTVSTGQ